MKNRECRCGLFACFLISFLGLFFVTVSDSHGQLYTLKIAIPQQNSFNTTIPTLMADKMGFLKEEGIKPEIFWTSGGAETVRVIAAGSADVALMTGTESIITAFMKGSPVRIISAGMTGAPDILWIVRADSPYRTMKDLAGKSVGYSRAGSSSHMILQLALDHFQIKAKLVPVGAIADSFTAVMTKQVDAGWWTPPYLLDRIEKGEIRVVFNADEIESIKNVTLRVNFANANFYEKNLKLVKGFLRAQRKAIDYIYDNLKETGALFAEINKYPLSVAEAGIKYFPKQSLALSPIRGVDFSVDLAIKLQMITKAPSQEDLKKLIVAE